MISVGLDIQRLGLWSCLASPRPTRSTSRRPAASDATTSGPGLVVTLLNIHKPRDRSHYERFRHYHETFYRSVEVTSVTPFSAGALDRGFAGALVALARHVEPALTPPRGVERIDAVRGPLEKRLLDVFLERVRAAALRRRGRARRAAAHVQNRIVDLLDSWRTVVDDYAAAGVQLQYQSHEGDGAQAAASRDARRPTSRRRTTGSSGSTGRCATSSRRWTSSSRTWAAARRGRDMSRKAHGQLRRGQVITTWGPGALIDLPRHSAIVGGLEEWPRASRPRGDHRGAPGAASSADMTGVPAPRLYAPPMSRTTRASRHGDRRLAVSRVVPRPGGHSAALSRERSRRLVHRKALDASAGSTAGRRAHRFVRACPRATSMTSTGGIRPRGR